MESEPSDTDSSVASSWEEAHHGRRGSKRSGTQREEDNALITMTPRPSAGPGGWLCLLIPVALGVRLTHSPSGCRDEDWMQRFLTVAAAGMALDTLCFYIYVFAQTGILVKCLVSLLPGVTTSLCFCFLANLSALSSVISGFLLTVTYQHLYIGIMRGFEKSFSYGEASVFAQGVYLFALSVLHRFWVLFRDGSCYTNDFDNLNLIMLNALFWLTNICLMLAVYPWLRKPIRFYLLMGLLVVTATCMPVTQPIPLVTLLQFLHRSRKRFAILGFYLMLVGLTCITVSWQLKSSSMANTRVRKIFHLLIVLVYVPGLIFECSLLYLATGVALAAFVVLEMLRLLHIPPLAGRLAEAFRSFKDDKDAGDLALTPFCLLIGCSMPIWMTPCPCSVGDTLALLSGILAVGVGDTAASIVGSKYGRNKWGGSTRSLEGTAAFVVSILVAVGLLNVSGLVAMTQAKWFATVFAALNSALVEAFTDQVDNLVLPLIFYIIVGLA